jgi:hypothetical protein
VVQCRSTQETLLSGPHRKFLRIANCCTIHISTVRAYSVYKPQNQKSVKFRQKHISCESRIGFLTRSAELAHQRRSAICTEPLAQNSYLGCIAQKFTENARNRTFSTQSAETSRSLRRTLMSQKRDKAPVYLSVTGSGPPPLSQFASAGESNSNNRSS